MIGLILFLFTLHLIKGDIVIENGLVYEDDELLSVQAKYEELSFPNPTTLSPTESPTTLSPTESPKQNDKKTRDTIKKGVNDGTIRICFNDKLLNKTTKAPKITKAPKDQMFPMQ